MGLIRVTTPLRARERARKKYSADFLVDTGATDSLAPAKELKKAGIKSRGRVRVALATLFVACSLTSVVAQESVTVLTGTELANIVPQGFYFLGLSAPTQMRNAAAARFGSKRYVIAGLVDTAGYAADVRAKYLGFFITDSLIRINGSDLGVGAYGFGFSEAGKMQILDLAGSQVLTTSTTKDTALKRPRPLMMSQATDGLRLYNGRDYVTIVAR